MLVSVFCAGALDTDFTSAVKQSPTRYPLCCHFSCVGEIKLSGRPRKIWWNGINEDMKRFGKISTSVSEKMEKEN